MYIGLCRSGTNIVCLQWQNFYQCQQVCCMFGPIRESVICRGRNGCRTAVLPFGLLARFGKFQVANV